MNISLVFLKDGVELLEVTPGKHTGRIVAGRQHWPETSVLTLPADSWFDIIFARNLWHDQMACVADCDEILLTASTVDGESLRAKVGAGFVEASR